MSPDPPESPLYLPGGKLLIKSGKMVTNPTECCCAEACENCEGDTPRQFRVTFSGVNLCAACYGPDPTDSVKWDTNPNPALAASYVLDQGPLDPCHYSYTAALIAGQWSRYDTADCTGAPNTSSDFDGILVDLNVTPTGLGLAAYYTGGWWGCGIFSGGQATATPCGGTTIINNTEPACNNVMVGMLWPGYTGGTATVVAV